MTGGHAHLGIISILAIVLGCAAPALEVTGRLRTAVTGQFIAGQWGIPGLVWLGEWFGMDVLMPTGFLRGSAPIASVLIMLYATPTGPVDVGAGGSVGAAPADD